jgi:acetyl esterase
MAGLLDRIRRAKRPPFHELSPEMARAAYGVAAEVLDLPRAPLPRVESVQVPVAPGCSAPRACSRPRRSACR